MNEMHDKRNIADRIYMHIFKLKSIDISYIYI